MYSKAWGMESTYFFFSQKTEISFPLNFVIFSTGEMPTSNYGYIISIQSVSLIGGLQTTAQGSHLLQTNCLPYGDYCHWGQWEASAKEPLGHVDDV